MYDVVVGRRAYQVSLALSPYSRSSLERFSTDHTFGAV